MTLRDLLAELKRRRVFRVAGIYVVAMFATLQGAQVLIEGLELPSWTMRLFTLTALLAFPIVVVLAWAFDVTPSGVQRASATDGKRAPLYVGLGIVIAIVGFGAYSVFDSEAETATETVTAATSSTAIAVLPFVNMSADEEQEYFSDGLTEEMLNALAQVPELRVAARTSSFAFKGKNLPVADVARALNVTTVLEGSVRKAGNQVRITAQLIDAASGHHLWSQTYDRELTDIFAIQEEISRAITSALKVKLGARTSDALAAHATGSLEAYDLYLQARFFWNRRNAEGLERAQELLEQAIALDPNYASAYAGLADVYSVIPQYAGGPLLESLAASKQMALRALALDSTLAQPYATLGMLSWQDRDWERSDASLRRAISLKPNYATAYQWRSWTLRYMRRHDEATASLRKALELDPLSLIINTNYGEHLILQRRYDEGIAQLRRTRELDPAFSLTVGDLAWAHALKGDLATGIAYADTVLAMPGTRSAWDLGNAGYALARAGLKGRAEALLPALQRQKRWGAMAYIYIGLGDTERAISALEKGRVGDAVALQALHDPAFESIHDHPRIKALYRQPR